jgi:hypothetical protein
MKQPVGYKRLIARLTLGVVCLLLVRCGTPDLTTAEPSGVEDSFQQPASTATADIAATKDALLNQQAYEIATVNAGGQLPTSIATLSPRESSDLTAIAAGTFQVPTAVPLSLPQGITACGEADHEFKYGNCWSGAHDQDRYELEAGQLKSNPLQGAIRLYMTSLDGESSTPMMTYTTPTAAGLVIVESGTWPIVSLVVRDNPQIHYAFNLSTRQWVDTNGTPLLTTPTATPVGQWVQSLTLFNADTNQSVAGSDPLLSGSTMKRGWPSAQKSIQTVLWEIRAKMCGGLSFVAQ